MNSDEKIAAALEEVLGEDLGDLTSRRADHWSSRRGGRSPMNRQALSNLASNFAIVGRLKRAGQFQVWAIVAGHHPAARIVRAAEAECLRSAMQHHARAGRDWHQTVASHVGFAPEPSPLERAS
jgi:hypothetical protein